MLFFQTESSDLGGQSNNPFPPPKSFETTHQILTVPNPNTSAPKRSEHTCDKPHKKERLDFEASSLLITMFRGFIFIALVLLVDGQTIAPVFIPTSQPPSPFIAPVSAPPITAAPTFNSPILPATVAPVSVTIPTITVPSVSIPTIVAPALPPGVTSLPPVLNNYPAPPGGFAVCNVCGEGYVIVNETATVNITALPGLSYTCAEAREAGLLRIIPDLFCTGFIGVVVASCGCDANVTTLAPSATPQDEDTKAPTSAASVIQGLFSSVIGVVSLLLL